MGDIRIAKTWDDLNPVVYDNEEPVSTRVLEKQYRDMQGRIQSLEAPFILTDTPPSDLGRWWCAEKDGSHPDVIEIWQIDTHRGSFNNGFWLSDYKWGSAPLPLPRGED